MVSIVTVWTRRDQTLGVRRAEMSVLGLCGQAVAITRGVGRLGLAVAARACRCRPPFIADGHGGRAEVVTSAGWETLRPAAGCTRVTWCRDLLPAARSPSRYDEVVLRWKGP